MNLIIYITIFIIGTLLGSFFTLAVYRIPLKKDITHERSFCPNCNHRLEFFDLIPVLSYIFLGGKCRYCKQKIRPRYILLELFSGIIFLLFYISLKIDLFNIDVNKIIYFIFGIFYISTLFIIGGIEKEKHYIPSSVFIFGLTISAIYIIYLYIINAIMYKYVIYFVFMFIITILNFVIINKKEKQNYYLQILILVTLLLFFIQEKLVIIGVLISLILGLIKSKLNKKTEKIPFGFYLCFTNIALLIINNYTYLIK